jgi:PleD family two-component response regulator
MDTSPESLPSLLIVEDDLDIAEMLDAYFRVQGYDVNVVNWGEDAIKFSNSKIPDIVILDIRLPDIDGFEVAHQLRTNRKTKEIPIIFLTERRNRSDRLQGFELGADDYLTKPFDVQELRLRVRNALRRSAQGPLTNPITNLPEGVLVDERLLECLGGEGWAILAISLENLAGFNERYGFVSADDVLRAVALMIRNTIRDESSPSDFIGQIGMAEFIVVTFYSNYLNLKHSLESRIEQSLDYFYPLRDRERKEIENRLCININTLTYKDGPFVNIEKMKQRLLK